MADISVTLKTGTQTLAPMKKIPVGNFGDGINFTIQDSTGAAENLTGTTPKLTLYAPGAQRYVNQVLQKDCSLVSASDGTCRYTVLLGDFNDRRSYYARVEIFTSTTKI